MFFAPQLLVSYTDTPNHHCGSLSQEFQQIHAVSSSLYYGFTLEVFHTLSTQGTIFNSSECYHANGALLSEFPRKLLDELDSRVPKP